MEQAKVSELSKRYEELAGKFADALDDLVPTDDAAIDLKELAKLAAESVLRESLPALKKEWEEEFRQNFSKECERFHNEGRKCATCGRVENPALARKVGIVPKCSRQEADEVWSQLVKAAAGQKLSAKETYRQMAVHDKVNAFLATLNNGQRATILEMIRLDMIAQLEEKEALAREKDK